MKVEHISSPTPNLSEDREFKMNILALVSYESDEN